MEKEDLKEFVVYGRQPVIEALRSEYHVHKILLARETDKKTIQPLLNQIEKKDVPVQYLKKAELQRHCGPVHHQGVVACIEAFKYRSETEILKKIGLTGPSFILILDQIQDPQNLGAIFRSAEIAGVDAVIIPDKGSAAINATVAKTSAGAIFHCPVCRPGDLAVTLQQLKQAGLRLYALVAHQKKTIFESDLTHPLALVIGSEGRGVRKNIERLCDDTLSIPGIGKIDSLNASVSTAIVLFEVLRQRRYK